MMDNSKDLQAASGIAGGPLVRQLSEITLVVGSHRHNSQSRKVAEHLSRRLLSHSHVTSAWILDLAEQSLPLWDERAWDRSGPWEEIWPSLSQRLQKSSAFIIVSPEWGGMVPAALKNFFLMCDQNELAHKAGLIVSVSAGAGGHYPVSELRMGSHKNTRLCYVPDHVIVQRVETVLNTEGEPENDEDRRIRNRLHYALEVFLLYAAALDTVRASPVIDLKTYPYGM